jgi:hypothetical protein
MSVFIDDEDAEMLINVGDDCGGSAIVKSSVD